MDKLAVKEISSEELKPLKSKGSVRDAGEKTRPVVALKSNCPERKAVGLGDDLETTLVRSFMARKTCFCFEHQSVDEARTIMRENHLQYLPVLDNNLRVVGTVAMRDLPLRSKQE